jgi:hypothetical protein
MYICEMINSTGRRAAAVMHLFTCCLSKMSTLCSMQATTNDEDTTSIHKVWVRGVVSQIEVNVM